MKEREVVHLPPLDVAGGKLHAQVYVVAFVGRHVSGFEWQRSEIAVAAAGVLWQRDQKYGDATIYLFEARVMAGATRAQIARAINGAYLDHCLARDNEAE